MCAVNNPVRLLYMNVSLYYPLTLSVINFIFKEKAKFCDCF